MRGWVHSAGKIHCDVRRVGAWQGYLNTPGGGWLGFSGVRVGLCLWPGVFGGRYCYYFSGTTRWCSYGCCGGQCCSPNVAFIVGMTVLGVLVVSTIIAVICCCRRRRAAAGAVIRANPAAGVVVASSQTTMMAGQPMAPYSPPQGYQAAPYAPQPGAYPYPAQPYPAQAYPMGPQTAPVYPYGGPGMEPTPGNMAVPTAPPPYTSEPGAQVNAGYDKK
ncbi:hypothetical protein ACOMHN_028044 [Nucella lapillus]